MTTQDALQHAASIQHDLQGASGLPGVLAAGFDAFEAIRLLARGNENRDPGLFAAFMMAADAAVDGREALTASPSLPPPPRPQPAPPLRPATRPSHLRLRPRAPRKRPKAPHRRSK